MGKKQIVSFDFDDTLSRLNVQEYAKELIDRGIEVHITTIRFEDPKRYPWFRASKLTEKEAHSDLFRVANRLGIDVINFTNFEYKHKFFEDSNYLLHIDDNEEEKSLMGKNDKVKTKCVSLNFMLMSGREAPNFEWKKQCEEILKQ